MSQDVTRDNPYSPPSLGTEANWQKKNLSMREFLEMFGDQCYVAKLHFVRVFLIGVFLTSLVAIPLLWFASGWGLVDWKIVGPACLLGAVLQAVVIRWQSIVATPNLLRCSDFWGRYHTIQWVSVRDVRRVGWGFFRFLRIENDDSKNPIWLPLFLEKPTRFWGYLQLHLRPSNPLRSWMDRFVG